MKKNLTTKAIALSALFTFHFSLFTLSYAQQTPLMGWSSWNTFGININDQLIRQQADAMVNSGLAAAGYAYINIDDGYFANRDENGKLLINTEKFPDGLKPVADYIHSKGLKAGIYNDAGVSTCACNFGGDKGGEGAGLYGHDQQDIDMYFKDCDFDFIKVDFCGGVTWAHKNKGIILDPQERYTAISKAIKKTGKKGARLNACRWDYPGTWIGDVAESWRTTGDINCSWRSVKGIIEQNLYLAAYSSKGHYNDMDMLEVGRGLTEIEDETHFGLWCIMNSPLLVGCDMRDIKPAALALMTNKELIALNQDPLGQQAYVAKKSNDCYILVKDIEKAYSTTRAVAIYNPTDTARTVRLIFKDVDLAGDMKVRDLFRHSEVKVDDNQYIAVEIPAHGTQIYKLTATERLERNLYEAETGYIDAYQELKNYKENGNGIYEYDAACSGGMKASWLGKSQQNALQWKNVFSRKGGEYRLRVKVADYKFGGEVRKFSVEVNGKKVGELSSADHIMNIKLKKGENTIRLYNANDWMPNIDCINVDPVNGNKFSFTGNPLVHDNYTADPATVVVGNTLYLFTGHDEAYEDQKGWEGQYGFNITGWLCYSTKDMKTWTDHGIVMTPTDFAWGKGEAWASQMVEKDGKYYYYVTVQAGEPYNCKAIGVAVSDNPTGPYKDALGKPLIEDKMTDNGPRGWWNDIDPTVLIDDDGTPYLCWGNGSCFMVRLKKNMIELDDEIHNISVPQYTEGPWLHKANGWYYLTYAGMGQGGEDIRYAMAKTPYGPWEAKGELTGAAEGSFTIHPAVTQFNGKWYLFYHNSTLKLNGYRNATGRRSVCFDELFYNEDGTMKFVNQTKTK